MRVIGLLLLLWGAPPARAAAEMPAPQIELYTLGPGTELAALFGHAVLCVRSVQTPDGLCYHYTIEPPPHAWALVWRILSGQARLQMKPEPLDAVIEQYRNDDRSIYRQVLPLSPDAARVVAAHLETARQQPNLRRDYHSFQTNCTTPPRDLINAATGGALTATQHQIFPKTFRELLHEGFAQHGTLILASELLVGRAVDRRPTIWEAMFLPHVLRDQVAQILGAEPQEIYPRHHALPQCSPIWFNNMWLVMATLLVILPTLALRTGRRLTPHAISAAGVGMGTLALVLDLVAIASPLPELRHNELLLVLWPTDLALGLWKERARMRYLQLRLATMVVMAALAGLGIFKQPLWAPLGTVAIILAAAHSVHRRYGREQQKSPTVILKAIES